MNIKQELAQELREAAYQLYSVAAEQQLQAAVSYPPEDKFGDYSSPLAMQLAPIAKQSPQAIAEAIKSKLGSIPAIDRIEVVPPGHLNFFLDWRWLSRQTGVIIRQQERFGRSDIGARQRVLIEFVSANPTGPLHMGNGRGAFMGDTLARVMNLAGYIVDREYYVNDMGNQVDILAESVLRRYWQQQGIRIEYPEYCYQGEYVRELAEKLFVPNYKLNNADKLEQVRDKIKGRILEKMLGQIRKYLEKQAQAHYDKWFSEKSLYESGEVDRILQLLKERGLLYKKEGAIWLKTSHYGDSKDRVLIKSNQEPVYFLSDLAYHWDKLVRRSYDKAINIWGADHHGYVGRMQAAMNIFGQSGKLDIIIVQLVRLMSGGKEVKMSKRAGTFVTLDELTEAVGIDAARFFFLMHDAHTHMDFDMDLARQQSKENPVYYVQYAHARICSILKKAKQLHGAKQVRPRGQQLHPSEVKLIKKLLQWPEHIADIAQTYHVHRIPFYALELATAFHDFYTQCQVIEGDKVNQRRLKLIQAAQIVLQNVLHTIGVKAPEQM